MPNSLQESTKETASSLTPIAPTTPMVPTEEATLLPTPVVFSGGQQAKGKRRGKHAPRPTQCLNCNFGPLHSAYCPDCGQENVSYNVPLPALIADVGEEFAKWDGRLMRTLKALLFRPGLLTREYAMGRRARYVSPFKLYFVVSALFVTLLSLVKVPDMKSPNLIPKPTQTKPSAAQTSTAPPQAPSAPKPNPSKSKPSDVSAPSEISETTPLVNRRMHINTPEEVTPLVGKKDGYFHVMGRPVFSETNKQTAEKLRPGHYVEAYEQLQAELPKAQKDSPLRHAVVRQTLKLLDTPAAFVDDLRENSGKALFFLLPVYAMLLAILFRGAKRFYLEHLVFAVNLHTFVFIIGGAITLIDLTIPRYDEITPLLLLLIPVYEHIALRRVYGQGLRWTLFKQWIIAHVYGFALLIGLLVTVIIRAALF